MSTSSKLKKKGESKANSSTIKHDKSGATISGTSPARITSIEDAVDKFGIDTDLFSVKEAEFKLYQQGMKIDGEPATQDLHGYRVRVERKAPPSVQNAIRSIIKDWKPKAYKVPKRAADSDDTLIAELSLYDAHVGKVSAEGEDIGEVVESFLAATDRLLDESRNYNLSKIILPVGQDFFNVDNFQGTTTKGTVLPTPPEHFTEVFRLGWTAMEKVIGKCLQVAPVEALWVPGNHDKSTSFYLVELLRSRFEDTQDVSFDLGLNERKYREYGLCLFGYTHGEEIKLADLPLLMATECDKWIGGTDQERYWRIGHFHRKREVAYTVGDTFKGVRVQVLPPLCVTDRWHMNKGFVNPNRAAEMTFWRKTGYKGNISEDL